MPEPALTQALSQGIHAADVLRETAAKNMGSALCAVLSGPAEGSGLWEGERKGGGVRAGSRGFRKAMGCG